MKRFIRYFVNGLLFTVPLSITIYIFYIIFVSIDRFLLRVPIPGVGFVATVLLIVLVGFLASNIVTRKYFDYIDIVFTKVPLIKIMYSAIKDFTNAFVGAEKKFNRPALITLFPEQGIKVMGFVTSEGIDAIGLKDEIAVYVPQSYNFAGNLLIVKKDRVEFLDIKSAKAMAIIVSAAVAGHNTNNNR
ncbi:DUF502 domain-containing protein [bacterium]